MTITTLRPPPVVIGPDPAHAKVLSGLSSLAERIRYACQVVDGPVTVQLVRTWLSEYQIDADRPYASRIVNGWRRERGLTDTGEIPVLTPDVLASMTVATPAESTPDPVPHVSPAEVLEPVTAAATEDRQKVIRGRLSLARQAALVVPLILVNAVAVYGQVAWAQDHLGTRNLAVAIVFACALESIGLFLAAEAHASLMAGDSSGKLRMASYAIGALVGGLNYAHYAGPHNHPTPAALAFGALSTISPWLWAVRSRSMHRAELRAQKLIDPRAVKFSTLRWVLYPVVTFRAFRAAVWVGETDPTRAVLLLCRREPLAPSEHVAMRHHARL